MTEGFLESHGIAYRTNEHRPGRQTLVFVHGLSGSSSVWLPYEEHFKERYNLLTFDLRGHGKSHKPRSYRGYHLSEFAKDLAALIEHLGVSEHILINHSFGTLVGLEYLHARPHGVKAVVFLSPNYGVHGSPRARLAQLVLVPLVRAMALLPFSGEPRGRTDYRKFRRTGDFNPRRMLADLRNTSLRVYSYCLEHAYRFNRTVWWSKVVKPTLILHGEHDKIIPAQNAVRMAEAMPHAKLVLLPKTDHVMVINDIKETERDLEAFLAEHA